MKEFFRISLVLFLIGTVLSATTNPPAPSASAAAPPASTPAPAPPASAPAPPASNPPAPAPPASNPPAPAPPGPTDPKTDQPQPCTTIIDTLTSDGSTFSRLVAIIQRDREVKALLGGKDKVSFIAPSNTAFQKAGKDEKAKLESDPKTFLRSLIIKESLANGSRTGDQQFTAMDGSTVIVNQVNGQFTVNGVSVTNVIATTCNGPVFVINAFPTGTVVPGTATASQNIFENIASDPRLTTLASALVTAGLDDDLATIPAATMFAPTDTAFSAISSTALNNLLSDQATLIRVLQYHVVPQTITSPQFVDGTLTTLEGSTVNISTSPTLSVNGVQMTVVDDLKTNGVVHFIDQLLLPPGVTLEPTPAPNPVLTGIVPSSATSFSFGVATVVAFCLFLMF